MGTGAAGIINALSASGLEFYAASQGQPINASTIGGVPSVSTGSVLAGTSGTLILVLAIVAVVVAIIFLR